MEEISPGVTFIRDFFSIWRKRKKVNYPFSILKYETNPRLNVQTLSMLECESIIREICKANISTFPFLKEISHALSRSGFLEFWTCFVLLLCACMSLPSLGLSTKVYQRIMWTFKFPNFEILNCSYVCRVASNSFVTWRVFWSLGQG